jgi:hypothetical protein
VTDSLDDALKGADVVLVTTTDKNYTALTAEALLRGRQKVTVIDFWRCLKHLGADPRIRHIPIGRGADAGAAGALAPLWS